MHVKKPLNFFILLVCLTVLSSASPKGRAASVPPFNIPRLSEIQIDGDKTDWGNKGFRVGLLNRIISQGAKAELSDEVDMRLAWDDQGVLVLLQVQDAVGLEADIEHLWHNDAIELFFTESQGSQNFYQVIMAPGMDPLYPEPRWQIYDHRENPAAEMIVEAVRTKTPKGYLLEMRFPWSNLKMVPKEGLAFAMQVLLHDSDVSREREDRLSFYWYPNRRTDRDSNLTYPLRLSDDASLGILAKTTLQQKKNAALLHIITRGEYIGSTIQVQQDGKQLGTLRLEQTKAGRLATGKTELAGVNMSGPPLTLLYDGKRIDEVLLYGALTQKQKNLIDKAMNAVEEKTRFRYLKQLAKLPETNQALQADIQTLWPVVERWAMGREMADAGKIQEPEWYLGGSISTSTPAEIRTDSPLYPMFCLYRGRHLIWHPIQFGSTVQTKEGRNEYFPPAREYLRVAQKAAPDNPIIGMYLDKPIPWPIGFQPDPNAPEWANLQREGLEKLTDIMHWWADNRQLKNGAYGGGWNDDVELWRNFVAVFIAFQDPKLEDSQHKLAEGLFAQPHMQYGYTTRIHDVEHTAEDTADTITPMMLLFPDQQIWKERALFLLDRMLNIWTGVNERGMLQFKSLVFDVHRVSEKRREQVDVTWNSRAVEPALAYWHLYQDHSLSPIFSRWMDTWVAGAASSEHGKPAGILPSAILWPEGRVGGVNPEWWVPNAFGRLYYWPGALDIMFNTLALTWEMTDDDKYIEPVLSAARIRQHYLKKAGTNAIDRDFFKRGVLFHNAKNEAEKRGMEPGSLPWCAAQLGAYLPAALAKYRFLSGDTQFDDVLRRDANAYVHYRLDKNMDVLLKDLREAVLAFRFNRDSYTSQMRYTDRMFRFTKAYANYFENSPLPLPEPRIFYAMASGDVNIIDSHGSVMVGSMRAVRWLTSPQEIAALVTDSDSASFRAELYHFGKSNRMMEAELYRLKPGRYRYTVRAEGNMLYSGMAEVKGNKTRIALNLPARKLCVLEVTPHRKSMP